ncbi:MAG TPA: HD domain-containing phosphohydrolase [Candidatus Hydrogenedentes bacterium]|nr:HD domain-containing phosphohydrolase [Candidatus Hydrogenedentota bacterium]HQH54106.1 HD domain-containing phosphohydrolase [Candidatus Hydrogenedentota bacterium]HQM47278.1 HD domain-containing phosphohydrolase [Candidatus Hydrogenedentota bacterium]
MGLKGDAVVSEPAQLIPVPVDCLRDETVTSFNLYLRTGGGQPPVLYREKHLPFTEEDRRRLQDNNVKHLFVDSREEKAYLRYLEKNLGAILADPEMSLEHKTDVVYDSGRFLLREVFADPRAGDTVNRSKAYVQLTYEFLSQEKTAFAQLLRITSYDYYTYTHSINVFVFSITLAQRSGTFSPKEVKDFGAGALLHDIGKSLLDPSIVNCKGKLTDEQWQEMKRHPELGCRILDGHGGISPAAMEVVHYHHEKVNGSGYPEGRKANGLSLLIRMCTIADIFDALTTKRSYKGAVSSFDALNTMKHEMSEELDTDLLQTFIKMMGKP